MPTPFNNITDSVFVEVYPRVQVGTHVLVSDLAFADDIVLLSNSYSEMQGLLEAVGRGVAAAGMRTSATKTKAMSAHIPCEQHQADVFNDGRFEAVDNFKCLSSMLARYLPQTARTPKRSEEGYSCPFRIHPPAILSLVMA